MNKTKPDALSHITKKPFFQRALLAAGALISVPALFLPVANPDIHWHFSAARWILANHRLPSADFLSWTQAGGPWIDFEWLPQLLFYGAYRLGGFWALIFFKALLISAAIFFFARLMRLYRLENLLFLLIPLLTAALLPSLDIRPDNFTLAFFSAEVYWLEKYRLEGPRGGLARRLAAAALFFCIWANLHAGFAYGLLLLGMYTLGEFISAALPAVYGRGGFLPLDKTRQLCACLAAGAAGTLVNAYGWKIYLVLFQHMAAIKQLQEHIVEWHSSDIYLSYQRIYWVITIAAFTALLRRFTRTRDIPYAHLLAVLYFSLASSSHCRNSFFMALTALPFTLYTLSLEEWTGRKLLAARAFMLGAALLTLLQFRDNLWGRLGEPWDGLLAPEGAAEFLKLNTTRLSPLRMYNPWGWGGYLGYTLSPDYKVFVDGRYIFHQYLDNMTSALRNARSWKAFAEEHGIELAIVERLNDSVRVVEVKEPDGKRGIRFIGPIYSETFPIKDWAMVYWDAQALVFVKRGSVDANWLKGHEYRVLRAGELLKTHILTLEGLYSADEIKLELIRYLKGPHGKGNFNLGYETGEWFRRLLQTHQFRTQPRNW